LRFVGRARSLALADSILAAFQVWYGPVSSAASASLALQRTSVDAHAPAVSLYPRRVRTIAGFSTASEAWYVPLISPMDPLVAVSWLAECAIMPHHASALDHS
jgi:hypothetical protein